MYMKNNHFILAQGKTPATFYKKMIYLVASYVLILSSYLLNNLRNFNISYVLPLTEPCNLICS